MSMSKNNLQHPSKDIIESKGTILRGKTVCMCLTGSVAVISTPIVARELMRMGAEVICVMSKAATELINPSLMEWATGNKVITRLTGAVEHIYLAGDRPTSVGKADLIYQYNIASSRLNLLFLYAKKRAVMGGFSNNTSSFKAICS